MILEVLLPILLAILYLEMGDPKVYGKQSVRMNGGCTGRLRRRAYSIFDEAAAVPVVASA